MVVMHWNYKDLFRACRLAFSAKKVWMQFVGFVVGGAGYTALTYLAYALSGVPLAAVWERFGLIPWLDPHLVSPELSAVSLQWWSWAVWLLGLLYYLVVALVAAAAVAKVTIEQLRGDDFFDAREAFRFAISRFRVLVVGPAIPVAFAAIIIVLGFILSLAGTIPALGDLLLGLLALPAFGASLFVLYLILVFTLSLALVPAIAGTTRHDSFDAIFEVFSCVNEQPWRLVVYSAVVATLGLAAAGLLALFSLEAVRLGNWVLRVFVGTGFDGIASGGPFYLRLSLPSWCPVYRLFEASSGSLLSGELTADGVTQNLAALLVGVAAHVVLLIVLGYGAAVWNTGMTISFVLLARKKDDKNLLEEREDGESLEETDNLSTDTCAGAGQPRGSGGPVSVR